ncbi:uncharacterized protein LOC126734526 [Anthonomus grandis grandis]|uniref:uncharacterized protein LOC126734526 n=1 Tax=Anthonomus grandis grandis TaxID=2921223 RepID=UPI002166AA09|nr:uncharacterized protein LOC126734526 [Anthonomus grandis grandis]
MAHGLNSVIKRAVGAVQSCKPEGKTGVGSRRIFSPQFKLQVLDSYRNDADCKGNQRATARKYGIHRRQIQKWLQVENTLRSGLNGGHNNKTVKVEVSLNGHRQRDDESSAPRSANLAGAEARVPTLEPPAGWQTHQQKQAPPPSNLTAAVAAPIDLSVKRATPMVAPSPPPALFQPSPSLRQSDVWDLSTNKRKAEDEGGAPTKPVKLFKPYLDDLRESDEMIVKKSPVSSPSPLYCCQPPLTCSPELYYINNNNNLCCDIMQSPEYHPGYTIQPKASYFHYPYYHPELSPTYHPYDEPVRQSYSLDFKVRTIDCYYQDVALCKGNPRAVVTKYNILRSQGEVGRMSENSKEGQAVR